MDFLPHYGQSTGCFLVHLTLLSVYAILLALDALNELDFCSIMNGWEWNLPNDRFW